MRAASSNRHCTLLEKLPAQGSILFPTYPDTMDFSRLFQSIQLDGEVQLDCPEGSIIVQASRPEQTVRVQFSNAPTFRYFLSSLPQKGVRQLRQQLDQVQQLPQAVDIRIADKPILEKPAEGKMKVYYRRAGREWLRWKTGL